MPLSTFDPLSNPRTSQVLFLLVQEVDTPTGLARRLTVKPPAVMEQLQRLRKIHVVKLGKKTGKEQHYTVDWENLVEIAVRRSLYLPQFKPSIGEDDILRNQLLRKEKFRQFVQAYLKIRIRQELGVGTPLEKLPLKQRHMRTFADVLEVLHVTILSMMIMNTSTGFLKTEDQTLQQVTDALWSWAQAGLSLQAESKDAFRQALEQVGFEIDPKVYYEQTRTTGQRIR